jgi:transcriptional regulator with XRE-family HTH domain
MTIDTRYKTLIQRLISIRKSCGLSQENIASHLNLQKSQIEDIEEYRSKIDVIQVFDLLGLLGYDYQTLLTEVGLAVTNTNNSNNNLPALPKEGCARHHTINVGKTTISGTLIEMAWRGETKEIFVENIPANQYLEIETEISEIYRALNNGKGGKNREAILHALTTAIKRFPNANPSDIYHHIVYRLYLREYNKTQADRSWVRAGGEAFELFLESHYNNVLNKHGITLKWLSNDSLKSSALNAMNIQNEVGGSKLDIALYGQVGDKQVIFGGIHAKASLAERVSDDVPCSEAMMRKGLSSYLVTFDSKSFPPPNGDLVNRGELGTIEVPSDKRAYIESHGSFSACFSYNTRTVPSGAQTQSGRKIFVSTFSHQTDLFPQTILNAWNDYRQKLPAK